MLLHDSVSVALQLAYDPPQYDQSGNQKYRSVTTTVPAEVVPLDTDAVLAAGAELVVSRYRMVLAPVVDIPQAIGNRLTITWQGATYGVDGAVERHMLRGRLHHYELITLRVV
ncbi:hypothetical protein ACN27E_13695 [Mycobacterium sp. WMMD1722]|uniref:hypothetical protein n=1 Tax=Mycobacterium sp. WMMD1722 TaxID=3404117 RepID=UPI003BF5A123